MALTTAIGAATVLSAVSTAFAAKEFDPAFYSNTWGGTCATGKLQTPIDLPARFDQLPPVPENLITEMRMPMVNNPDIINKGSAIQIAWDPATAFDMEDKSQFPLVRAGGSGIADVILDRSIQPDLELQMIPIQLHWHETSEHSWDGLLAAAETHIVTLVGPGSAPPEWGCDAIWEGGDPVLENCTAVFGVMYRIGTPSTEPGYLEQAVQEAPIVAGGKKPLSAGQLNVDNILPEDRSYYTYIGSLTTPGCNEGLRWHVFNQQEYITSQMMQNLENLHARTENDTADRPTQNYRHNNRPIQPTNGRSIMFHNAGNAVYPGSFAVIEEVTSAAAGLGFVVVPGIVAAVSCFLALFW